jgi:dihydroxyacid dehydratase/phosphogluconate dehydratase
MPTAFIVHEGPARVFTSEAAAIAALREGRIAAGDTMILAGVGPLGTGMEETYQITSALKMLPFGKHVALLTDARFSGVSTGACLGHIGPEALAGGPLGRLRDGDLIRVEIDRVNMNGSVDLVGEGTEAPHSRRSRASAGRTLASSRSRGASRTARGYTVMGCPAECERWDLGRVRV